jgi:hypothetical protein
MKFSLGSLNVHQEIITQGRRIFFHNSTYVEKGQEIAVKIMHNNESETNLI